MIFWPAIAIGRIVRFAIRRVRPGGGSALPGLVVSKIAPKLLPKTLGSFPMGLVVITGSAGKSTTTKMVVAILRAHGLDVFTNPSTANIAQGFYSTIVEQSNLSGRIQGDVAVLEMDEGHAAEITASVKPNVVTVLNVLEDQLDRFVDPALVREKLLAVANRASEHLVLNVDDQNLVWLDSNLDSSNRAQRHYVGISPEVTAEHEHGLGYAPTHFAQLVSPPAHSKVIGHSGLNCKIKIMNNSVDVALPSRGLHFALDAVAALQTAAAFLGESFNLELATEVLSQLPPVFARGEMVEISGQRVEFILVQNPTSFQLNLDALDRQPERLMIAVGRDVHDPSWLWTVDYKKISNIDVISGFNAAEMALCLGYRGQFATLVTDDLKEAFDAFMALDAPAVGVKTVIFSADAMRRSRRMLGFTSPDEVER